MTAPRHGVLLVNLGTPEAPTPEAVRAFLEEFLSDPLVVDWPRWLWIPILKGIVLRKRPAKVAALYREIWSEGGSPLAVQTRAIAEGLAQRLGPDVRVDHAYRYGPRSVGGTLRQWQQEGIRHPVVVPLFLHRTGSATGTIERLVESLRPSLEATVAIPPPDLPGYIEALGDRVRNTLSECPAGLLLLSFHGIPVRHDRREEGVYRRDVERTAGALRQHLGPDGPPVAVAFQSRFGPGQWLTPATDQEFRRLGRTGLRTLAVATPGFLTEGLETLEEIGLRGRRQFQEAGGREFLRVPAVVDHPLLLDGLAAWVRGLFPDP